ncbi:hypothetical protein FNW52_16265 [Flavobacterium sp. ZT3R18]|uniref:hypothetical protein n=1 Tax=Flavobacterium sp. ZT3R18 TaxID=2594429 RepID=UPI001179E2CD|nr:hypothetical protein [Flavobacterium sp. ZT3R18]TRX33007.1 hypothetical protein FNW52_16265 [Flavobacterium sp. ZT3R18]
MKSKLYITGLVSISLLTYSCSNDDGYEIPEIENNNFKITPKAGLKNELNEKTIDSSTVIFNIKASAMEGDPSNPKPPRS